MSMLDRPRFLLAGMAAVGLLLAAPGGAAARELTSQVTELEKIPSTRPEFPVPNEPHMLFYIQRSVNSNTVIYAANLDAQGRLDPHAPVEAYWRWYNVDGHRKTLNFAERMMAYGVNSVVSDKKSGKTTFKVAALPERRLQLDLDGSGHPEALMQLGGRWARLVYVYLMVDDSGLLPTVTALDLFGIEKATGKPLHEHLVPH
jgi:hypothetical protein